MSKAFELLLEVEPRRPAMPPGQVICSIDWARLRWQKHVLLEMLMARDGKAKMPPQSSVDDAVSGILNLLDDIQDCAAQMGQPSYEQPNDITAYRQVGKANNP